MIIAGLFWKKDNTSEVWWKKNRMHFLIQHWMRYTNCFYIYYKLYYKFFSSSQPLSTSELKEKYIRRLLWKLVKIILALIILYKMNTDNDALLKFWFHLVFLIAKQVQSCNLHEDGRFYQFWTCFVIKPLLK